MTLNEQLETLEIFVESADELVNSSFLKQASNGGIGTSISTPDGRMLAFDRTGPEHESVKALLLTIRFFCQDNETSIRNVAGIVANMSVADTLKNQFSTSQAELNTYLDGSPSIGFPSGDGAATNREIFETFLYGTFAHANREKRRRVKAWRQQPYFNDLRAVFDRILVEFVRAVAAMSNTCQKIREDAPK